MKKIHVYVHTHWDYEWYFTANESIIQLIYHMDEVIDALQCGVLTTYLLDSQVSILEEYLLFMPEKEPVIRQLVQAGKLQIGPWYTQSDELVIAGESMMRNLYYGITYARSAGSCLMVGYLPDSFGQSKDMPKLYAAFGIQDALFWRGVPSDVCEQREFIWTCRDGSDVYVANLKDGYFYGGNLIYNDDVKQVEQRLLQGAGYDHQLCSLGGDQRYVDMNLQERLAYYNQHSSDEITFVESNLSHYFDALHQADSLALIEGEFMDASVSKIHHSIYSTRYDHKQLNDRVERRILYQLEPFMVMQMAMGIVPKVSVLERLWKKLLLNHAHDSACGCNSDPTNRSILQRLQDCDEMSSMLLDYQVRKISESLPDIEQNDIVLYNTLPYTRVHTQTLAVDTACQNFDLHDEQGNIVPYDCRSCERQYRGSIRKDESLQDASLYYYHSELVLTIAMPAMSMRTIQIVEQQRAKEPQIYDQIANSQYNITCEDGVLNLFNKAEQTTIHAFLHIEDGGDAGDTYDYSYPETDDIERFSFAKAQVTIAGTVVPRMTLQGTWMVAKTLEDRIQGIRNVAIAYVLHVSLCDDLISCELTIDNTAIEHRMRVIMKGLVSCEESIADSAFGSVHRDCVPKHMEDWQDIGYREEPTPIYPMLHHVTLKDSMSCFTKGIKEYEILNQRDIALTLFRSVPFLGKPDLARRPGIASGNEFKYIETPDSCLLKTLHYAFALRYHKTISRQEVHKTWMNYATDYLSYQIQELNRFVNTQKYFVTHPYSEIKPCTPGLFDFDSLHALVYSTIRPLDEKRIEMRLYNAQEQCVAKEQIFLQDVATCKESNALQEAQKPCVLDEHCLHLTDIQPEQLKTFEITLK